MKRIILTLIAIVPAYTLFAQSTYWKTEKIKPVLQRSLIFEHIISELCSETDYYEYKQEENTLYRYDVYDLKEQPQGGKIEDDQRVRIIGGKLKILLRQGTENAAFIVCTLLKGSKEDFLKQVDKDRQFILQEKLKAVQQHPAVKLPLAKEQKEEATEVCFPEGFSLTIAPWQYLIVKQDNKYEFYDTYSKEEKVDFSVSVSKFNYVDSMKLESLFPVYNENNFCIATYAEYDPEKKKATTGSYWLLSHVMSGDRHINLETKRFKTIDKSYPFVWTVKSLQPTCSKALSYMDYNLAKRQALPEKQHKLPSENISVMLPQNYTIREFGKNSYSSYSFYVTEELAFSNENEKSVYYDIEDSTTTDGSYFARVKGGLYLLKDSNVKYDLAKDIEESKEQQNILLQDDTGYLYYGRGNYRLFRYFYKQGVHYVYNMEFPDLRTCLAEFVRSGKLIK